MSQKETFLASEGDAWISRNDAALAARDWSKDPVSQHVSRLALPRRSRVLEIGCGDGSRLGYLAATHGWDVAGVDPSQKAVTKARERGIPAEQRTADRLGFGTASFDLVIFGHCLYLCDDADLFMIAAEADRVAASASWIVALDFEAQGPVYKPYHHLPGIHSRKMDYKSLFLWHPSYTLADYGKYAHQGLSWTDDPDEWISVATLRKFQRQR